MRTGIDSLKMCKRKKAFASREAAAAVGMHVYECPICHFFHRTGSVLPLQNPVLPAQFSLPPEHPNQINNQAL